MPIGGTRQTNTTVGNSYRKSDLYQYAKAFSECADTILKEDGYDFFEEPKRVMRNKDANDSMRQFFTESCYDKNNKNLDAEDRLDLEEQADQQFDNDIKGLMESSALADYNPIVGMALPIHKLILMNNVFDKGGIQKVTAAQSKFTISLERRILVAPDGTEYDMFLDQNKMTDAIDSANPVKVIDLTLPVTEDKDIITDEFGGTSMDHLDISTYISAVKVSGVKIEAGDIKPNEDGYIDRNGEVADADEVDDVWFRTNINFAPNYGGLAA